MNSTKEQQIASSQKWRNNNKAYSSYSRNKSTTKSFIKKADFEDIALIEQLLIERKAELNDLNENEKFDLIVNKAMMINKVSLYDIQTDAEVRKNIKNKIKEDLKLTFSMQKITSMFTKYLEEKKE